MLYADHPFSEKFCDEWVSNCLDLIARGASINLVAMPGVGVTFLVRQLTYRSPDECVAINSFEMHEFTKVALYNQLTGKLGLAAEPGGHVDLRAIGEALKMRAGDGKIILIFNRFDRLGPVLDQGLYENLRFLRDVANGRLALLFVTAEPVTEFASQGIQDLLRLVDNVLYFPGYPQEDMTEIIKSSNSPDVERQVVELAGGHHALLQILSRCQNLDNALSDPMVELVIKDIYLGLTPKRRKVIETIATGHSLPADSFLANIGYVAEDAGKLRTFTPLLSEYALRQTQAHLPARERRLLKLLLRNAGNVVSKQDIFDTVWHEADGIASDWALNALVYRLRRHPAFDSQRYTIESHKKQGYILNDHRA